MTSPSKKDRSIAILVNPLSGRGKAKKIGFWLSGKLIQYTIVHTLFIEKWPVEIDDFTELWIVGGDGTINYFVNHFKRIQLPLVLFKGGTGNDFAWKLYGNISLDEQLELALNRDAKPIDVACCNGQLYLNSLGIGFDGEVLQSMESIRLMGGHLGYLLVVIRKIFSFKEFSFTVRAGNQVFKERFLLVIVNNSSRTGGGFMVAPQASLTDGRLDLVLCKPLSLLKRLRYLPVIKKGKHLDLPFIHFTRTGEVRIQCEKEIYAQLDGELIKASDFLIKILPGQLRFRY